MKTIYFILFLGVILSLGSCEIDNYDEPDALFSGQLTYQGEPVRVAADEVRFQLWQTGFGNEGPLDVHVAQDGSFSAVLFSGEYLLSLLSGEGPFQANTGEEQIIINGNTTMDIEVTPYYMISNAAYNVSGNVVEGSASLNQIITGEGGRNVERVTLYLNDAQFVSENSDENIAGGDANLEDLSNLMMSVEIPGDYDRNYIFARIGVKIEGVEDMLFSPVQKLTL
ncbi:DUF3823 domain-containing protein [Antarcticibacterium sp. 1MA-6-2]|uniref:DUF3823 domain-containing protein n=1 Tax=Antarcticibacterium sp. 1MA-6-2 TaxID=2908210 RepID=UPI001F1C79FF|nr:DUF3823 domain-containing protein [Antarcticibacterium sp. 1MA-6-2]UJH90743.1 DUF3823 domain-containing protein [Antarcticibacterium sp. 1MA-6-2]